MHLRQSRGRWAWDATPSMSEKKGEDAGRDAVSASLFERGLAGHAATGRIELGESVDSHGPTATLTLLRTPGARQNLPVGRRADTSGLTSAPFGRREHTPPGRRRKEGARVTGPYAQHSCPGVVWRTGPSWAGTTGRNGPSRSWATCCEPSRSISPWAGFGSRALISSLSACSDPGFCSFARDSSLLPSFAGRSPSCGTSSGRPVPVYQHMPNIWPKQRPNYRKRCVGWPVSSFPDAVGRDREQPTGGSGASRRAATALLKVSRSRRWLALRRWTHLEGRRTPSGPCPCGRWVAVRKGFGGLRAGRPRVRGCPGATSRSSDSWSARIHRHRVL
ncbi:hypothetical protein ABH937_003926 [Kitasatospora sp. GAS1066B]